MKEVTTAYHNANKADTRSSDFLIISDTGFSLSVGNGITAWTRKNLYGNELEQGMFRCKVKTANDDYPSDSVLASKGYYLLKKYGHFIFSRVDDLIDTISGITICFEDCFPTEYQICFYSTDAEYDIESGYDIPDSYSPILTNNSKVLQISAEDLFLYSEFKYNNLYEVRIFFKSWSKQGVKPVVLFTTYGEPAVFTKDDLLSVNVTNETDLTSQKVIYNSYACSVIDESDAYNPLLSDSKVYNFTSNQKFKFYNFEMGVNKITNDISLFDHEICFLGSAFFQKATQQGTTVNFEFIDLIEKYDTTYLSEEELELSSHFIKRNIREYLHTLFGEDLDINSVPVALESIVPFYEESKMQILLYLAQIMRKCIYLKDTGVISLKDSSEPTDDGFLIELAQSYQNPVIERVDENNGVLVNNYIYSLSQNSEFAINRIEFYYDGLLKAFIDESGNIYDAETEESIESLPKIDFEEVSMKYIFNDVYNRDSLFAAYNDFETILIPDLAKSYSDLGDYDEVLGDGKTYNIKQSFNYCDTHICFTTKINPKLSKGNPDYTSFVDTTFGALMLLTANIQGQKITSSKSKVQRKKYTSDSKGSPITIDNPAITDYNTAKLVRDWIYSQSERTLFSIDTDWRGDCSLELGDSSVAQIAITQNGVKNYERRYKGIVTKNIIEYNGALKMQSTLLAPVQ